MNRLSRYFRSLSLTQQIVSIVFVTLLVFFGFFFTYYSVNTEQTISNLVYETLASRQSSMLTVLTSNDESEEKLEYFHLNEDDYVKNVGIIDGEVTLLSPDIESLPNHEQVLQTLQEQTSHLSKSNNTENGTFSIGKTDYYYRAVYISASENREETILISYMDDSYALHIRSSLVDSTFDLMIIAFCAMLIILIAWVFSIIRPLNQLKEYVEDVKEGKDVELNLNRSDEIGELADSVIEMKDDLQRQEKSKEEMIHNISHDLKTPIATIKSYAESIKDGVYPYGTLESTADVIINNAQRLEDKVHNLLYLNRVEYLVSSDSEGVVTNMKDVIEQVVLPLGRYSSRA